MAARLRVLLLVTVAALITMATAINIGREEYRRGRHSSEDSSEEEKEDNSVEESSFPWSGSRSDLGGLWNFYWSWHNSEKPWWEGPNVCETEKVEEKNHTDAAGDDEGDFARHYSSSFHTCDESESTYKCTTTQQDMEGYRKIIVVYECCTGYERKKGDHGCPRRVQLQNLITVARNLGLTDFLGAARRAGLERELRSREVTIFAPVNGGFGESTALNPQSGNGFLLRDSPFSIVETDDVQTRVEEQIQAGLLAHVVSGARRSSSFSDEEVVETGGTAAAGIRINFFYTPKKNLMTANCVPVVSRDQRASNGVLHTVERFLTPVKDSLLDMVKRRHDLSTLRTVLARARYVPKVDEDGQGTLLAPTNGAFERMNPRLRARLLAGDAKCLQKVLDNHILPHTICSSVIQGNARTPNQLGNYLNISRSADGKIFVEGAQITQRDLMATNGVMHVIDKVIVPQEAMDFVDLLESEGYTELLDLVESAGLKKTLENTDNVTVFAPTNAAIQKLPNSLKIQLQRDPELLRSVLLYHVSPGAEERSRLHGNVLLPTLYQDSKIRIETYSLHPFHHYGVMTAQCVPLKNNKVEACNGRVRPIDQVMIPPRGNVVDVLARDGKFSLLVSLIKRAELGDSLQQEGPFTIFAPNNQAFERLGQAKLEELSRDVQQLKQVLKRHVYTESLCCAGIFRGHNWLGKSRITTLGGERLRVSRDYSNTPTIGSSRVVTCDLTATNGNVFEIDTVLESSRRRNSYRPRWNWDRYRSWDPYHWEP